MDANGDTGVHAEGPQGPTGATGATGATGPQGPTGPAGADGLTTQIEVNGTTYTQSSGKITLPDYPTVPSNYVTTDTNQTITGRKEFRANYNYFGNVFTGNGIMLGGEDIRVWTGGSEVSMLTFPRNKSGTLACLNDIPTVSGTNDGTNWTTITIGSDTYDIPATASVDWSDITNKPTFATVATSGSYNDLTDKPTIPAAVSGTNDGTNWTSLTIGSDTYNIPSGGGGGSGTDIIYINDTATSGTLSAADLAKVVDHPSDCVFVKYGMNAQYQQSYRLSEIEWTDETQTTVYRYTYEIIQNSNSNTVRDRKITVTASTGAWSRGETSISVPTSKYFIQTLRFNFSGIGSDSNMSGTVAATYPVNYASGGVSANSSLTSGNINALAASLQKQFPSGSTGGTTLTRYSPASGYVYDGNYQYQVIGIAGYRASSSSCVFYIVVALNNIISAVELPSSAIGSGTASFVYVMGS